MTEENKKEKKRGKKKRTLLQRIVNVFLYTGVVIFILFVIAFAVSQTSFFRNWLRETAMGIANKSLNGQLYIGRLEGTIFTSLILRDTYITMGNDTLLNASRIEVRTSPLQLLLKKIYIRKLELDDTRINLIRESSGSLNISRLVPPSQATDTTSSSFPFKIIVAELKIRNSGFSLRDYNINTNESYNCLNLHNLNIKNFNILLSAVADINKNDFQLGIHSFSFDPNINRFALEHLSGEFYVSRDSLSIDDLSVKTTASAFTLNSSVHNFSLFDTTGNNDFTKADLSVDLSAGEFSFSDLSVFVPSAGILQGAVSANVKTSGSLKQLHIGLLEVELQNTHLRAEGQIDNLDAGKDMQIATEFYDSYIDQLDISNLLPSLQVPVYKEYGILTFDTLSYNGKPLDFSVRALVKTHKGSVGVNGNLNLEKVPASYNLTFNTVNLDIFPVAGLKSKITSGGSVMGMGFKPDSMNASVTFSAGGSVIDGNRMDTLKLVANADNKDIKYKITASSDTLYASLEGSFDFKNEKLPSYDLAGIVRNLNLGSILRDTSMQTDFNFSVDASGDGFNPDSINLFLSTTLYNSSVEGIPIDSTRAIVDLRRNEGGERVVNIISDLADITITGNFKIMDAVGLLTTEMQIVSNSVRDKLNTLFPSTPGPDSLRIATQNISLREATRTQTRMDYVIEFKDFQLLSLFLGGNHIELDGDVQGQLEETADSLNFLFKTRLDYLKYWGKTDIFFLSKLDLNLELHNDLQKDSLARLNADADLSIQRVFTGNDINDLRLSINIEDDSAAVRFSGNLENYLSANIDSRLRFGNGGVDLTFDTLYAAYNQFDLNNKTPLAVHYSPDEIGFNNFQLFHKKGSISVDGSLKREGEQNLTVNINGITGKEISESLLAIRPENSIQSNLKLSADVKGNFDSPIMHIKLNADSVTYRNKNFGSLIAGLNYDNKKLNANIRFIDSLRNLGNPKLKITGDIPINLAFSGVQNRINEGTPVNIDIAADSFNLGAFGNLLPEVNRLRGELSANLHIGGPVNDLQPEGKIILDNADFIVEKNNLEYNAGLKVSITPDILKIDSLLLKNAPGTKNGGQMTGSGQAEIKNLQIVSSAFNISGQLKVLSEASKSASPSVYGNLVVSTQGNIEFELDSNGAIISIPVAVKEANLTFPQTESSYQNTSNDFIYVYTADTSISRRREADFQRLVDLSHMHNQAQQNKAGSGKSLSYKIDVHVEKEAKITFVLSKELNQNLTAILGGDFHYERINGRSDASGELNLLSGSTLEFLKTFEADGTIRFESELNNPYLDITATYTDYYYPASDSVSNNEVKVAVKIKITGFLKDLGKNLVQDQNNIAVYYGANNIQNNTPDPTKTASDAVLFILTGKFTEGATQQDRNAVASTAASLAGSVVGGFLNKQFGDLVRRVELRQVGTVTKFNLVGKAGDISYTIGGSTNIFQDISQANVKLEYPITNQLLIRLERKQSVTETTANINEMINELGLKYKFEF